MSDENNCKLLLLGKCLDFCEQSGLGDEVESGERPVKKPEVGPRCYGLGPGDSVLLTTGERLGQVIRE